MEMYTIYGFIDMLDIMEYGIIFNFIKHIILSLYFL